MAPRVQTGKIRSSHHFSALLSSAILEWVLMLLLLLEGLLAYLVTRFAHLCKLQPPCLMCVRIDHLLGKEEPGFYRHLMCNAHKAEVSSWAFCHVHQKIADVHSLCERCLFSFATEKKSNLETYRSLVGKLGVGIANAGCMHSLKKVSLCSCCSDLSEAKSCAFELLHSKSGGVDMSEIGIASSSSMLHNQASDREVDELTHVGYSELKTSDSESEVPFDNGDGRDSQADAANNLEEDFTCCNTETMPADDIVSDSKLVHENVNVLPSPTVLNHSKSIPNAVAHATPYCASSQTSAKPPKIRAGENAKLQPPDLCSEDAQQISSEYSDATEGNLETNVRHNATTDAGQLKAEFTDATIGNDSCQVHEDLKLLLSQISASPIPDSSCNGVQGQGEQAILHNITRTLSLEGNYSGKSLNGSMVIEIEGEYTVDRLKRQAELDQKSISLLWKELEEERNASAVAANQAMAMITRLQEEKAAMQMEASQYQRMMDEQAEYDREDLQKMTDLLAEREREVQQLEAEIESYKRQLRVEMLANEICDEMYISGSTTESTSGFDDEKAYISKCLRRLKQKLQQFSNNSNFIEAPKLSTKENGYDGDEDDPEVENSVSEKYVRMNCSSYKHLSIGIEDSIVGKNDPKGQYYAMISKNDLASFEDEISELSKKLTALEADHNFIEHSINSLKNGEEGSQFIQDIAHNLRDLRKIGTTWKEYD